MAGLQISRSPEPKPGTTLLIIKLAVSLIRTGVAHTANCYIIIEIATSMLLVIDIMDLNYH